MKAAFVYGPFLVWVLTVLAFVLRCRFRVRAQAVWAMVLLACFSKFFVYQELGGAAYTPELPERVIWVWNCAYSGAFILFLLSVLTLPFRVPWRAVVLPALAWGLSAWGVWNGTAAPSVVREISLPCEDLPESLDGYRIVHISDLHVSSAARRWRTERVVAMANACDGDLVVITGDFVDGNPRERLRDVMPLKDLKAKDGVYAVTGNHEAYFDAAAWMPWYERWGIRFLNNECVFPRKGLALGGVDERAFPQLHPGEDRKSICPSVKRTFENATNGEFRVFLQHRPAHAEENVRIWDVRLQLSGHTHGGVMPLMAPLIRWHNGDYVRGVYSLGTDRTAYLHVSPGVGQWAGFPIRFFNPTEITVITFESRKRFGK